MEGWFIVKMITDINELSQTHDLLVANKESIATAFHLIDDGVIITDVEGRIILINEVAETITGWPAEQATGRLLDEVLYVIDEITRIRYYKPFYTIFEEGRTIRDSVSIVIISRDGTEHIVTDKWSPVYNKAGNVIGFVLILCDISEKRKMEEKLLNAQRFDSVFASDIAHTFNNILTIIMGNISLAKRYTDSNDRLYERLTEVEQASMQAKDLTQKLLAFSRRGV